jgi:hypothetical protein
MAESKMEMGMEIEMIETAIMSYELIVGSGPEGASAPVLQESPAFQL